MNPYSILTDAQNYNCLQVINKLSQELSNLEPSDQRLGHQYFQYRDGGIPVNGTPGDYGNANRPIAVLAFRINTNRTVPQIESSLEPYGRGVDLLVDVLTVRTGDLANVSLEDKAVLTKVCCRLLKLLFYLHLLTAHPLLLYELSI